MLRAAVIFGVGYVLGTRAGQERYAQIRDWAQKVASRLEQTQQPSSEPSPQR